MKDLFSKFFIVSIVLFLSASLNVEAKKKILKISVVPSDAQISVDGNYVGSGVVEVTLDNSDFIAIKLELFTVKFPLLIFASLKSQSWMCK